ncbi:MAG: MBL fold metallo-hydrolase [Candidatus Methylomirabilales bacterium]
MEVTVLGSGTAVPSPERASPGFLVQVAEESLLLDGGTGTLRQLVRAGARLETLDRVLYTHYHPDHVGDFPHLLFALRSPEIGRQRPLWVGGPPGLARHYHLLGELYGPWVQSLPFTLELVELTRETVDFGSWRLTAQPVPHTDASLAYRIDAHDGSLVYSGDTDYSDALIDLARAADLLILDCACPEDHKVPGHLTPSLAGDIAARAGVKRLLLTHFYPACAGHDLLTPCRKHFPGNVLLARDLMRLTVDGRGTS